MFEEKLKEMGITLPEAPKPLAAYIPAIKADKIIYTSGQLPIENGVLNFTGKLGKDLDDEKGKQAAKISALNCLSVIKSICGSLDNIEQIIKVVVFVNSTDSFENQPVIANGASEFIGEIFGEKGKHARSAVGVASLPKNAAVEVEMIVKIK